MCFKLQIESFIMTRWWIIKSMQGGLQPAFKKLRKTGNDRVQAVRGVIVL